MWHGSYVHGYAGYGLKDTALLCNVCSMPADTGSGSRRCRSCSVSGMAYLCCALAAKRWGKRGKREGRAASTGRVNYSPARQPRLRRGLPPRLAPAFLLDAPTAADTIEK